MPNIRYWLPHNRCPCRQNLGRGIHFRWLYSRLLGLSYIFSLSPPVRKDVLVLIPTSDKVRDLGMVPCPRDICRGPPLWETPLPSKAARGAALLLQCTLQALCHAKGSG